MKINKGNIFTTKCQTIVNTVNCVGIMGAGIAYEFRLRHPKMYEKYKMLCINNQIDIGILWMYRLNNSELQSETKYSQILNFPTKMHWKYPTKIEYLEKGLQKFVDSYRDKCINSIAFPLLGASHGGLTASQSHEIMLKYLSKCNDIDIEIWYFDENTKDNLYDSFKASFLHYDDNKIATESGLRIDFVRKVRNALNNSNANSLMGLRKTKGIGEVTLEKAYRYVMDRGNIDKQLRLPLE